MRIAKLILCSGLLAGCGSQPTGRVCEGGDLKIGQRAKMEVYFAVGDFHGNNLAVPVECPNTVLSMRAGMQSREDRNVFWNELNNVGPSAVPIRTGRAIVTAMVEGSQNGAATLQVYHVEHVEQAYPPKTIADGLLSLNARYPQ